MGLWDVSTQLTDDVEGGFEELASLEAFCRGAFGYSLTLGCVLLVCCSHIFVLSRAPECFVVIRLNTISIPNRPCDGCGALPVLRVRQEGGGAGGAVGGKRGYRGLGSSLQVRTSMYIYVFVVS